MRAGARLIAMVVMTAVLYPAFVITRRRRFVRAWMSAMARILGVRTEISGPRPEGAFLLVANHLGFLDVLVIGAAVDAVFVAKSELKEMPLLGYLSSSTGTIFLHRTSPRDAKRVTDVIADVVKGGTAVVIFPEGTATDGSGLLPFKPALLEAAARERMPVHHAALHFDRDEAMWYGDESFGVNFRRLLRVPHVRAWLRFGAPIESTDRKELARQLHAAVCATKNQAFR